MKRKIRKKHKPTIILPRRLPYFIVCSKPKFRELHVMSQSDFVIA